MTVRSEFSAARRRWRLLTFYEKFEHAVVLIMTGLIALIVAAAVWALTLRILFLLLQSEAFDPTDYTVFQTVFGMIFTVIIALEFKRSILVVAERRESIIQVRTVVLLAMLAILRKIIILDIKTTEVGIVFGLSAALFALGVVYWLIRGQDRSTTP